MDASDSEWVQQIVSDLCSNEEEGSAYRPQCREVKLSECDSGNCGQVAKGLKALSRSLSRLKRAALPLTSPPPDFPPNLNIHCSPQPPPPLAAASLCSL